VNKLILILLTFFYVHVSGQVFNYRNELDYAKYYPLNEKNNVADTFSTQNLLQYFSNIGTSNSKIYKELINTNYSRVYYAIGDTIKSLRYNFSTKQFSSLEVFIYNKNKQIELYFDCNDYYFDKKRITVSAIQFFYNRNYELTDKLAYYLQSYNSTIDEFSFFDLKKFELTSAINYQIERTKSKTFIFGKECMGKKNFRSKDTLTISNNNGFLLKFNSYADNRSLGCPMGLYVNDIFEYAYAKDSVTITEKQIRCEFPGVINKCDVFAEPYITTTKRKFFNFGFNYFACINLRNTNKIRTTYILKIAD
jgi:hypothetical protein